MGPLRNVRYEQLCHEFLVDYNQTQAAIRTGYSAKSAYKQASEIFMRPEVGARVNELLAERSVRVGVTADRVVQELARVAFMKAPDVINLNDASVIDGLSDDDMAVISSVKVRSGGQWEEREVRMFDKLRALELLGKHLGMFTDRLNINTDVPTIVDDIGAGDKANAGVQ